MFFTNCHTPDELKDAYRYWAKKLHPDMDGDAKDFRQMHDEYERATNNIYYNERRNTLPELFSRHINYEYYFRPVKYVGIYYNYYYKFTQDFGADILIDLEHIRLIFEKRKRLDY